MQQNKIPPRSAGDFRNSATLPRPLPSAADFMPRPLVDSYPILSMGLIGTLRGLGGLQAVHTTSSCKRRADSPSRGVCLDRKIMVHKNLHFWLLLENAGSEHTQPISVPAAAPGPLGGQGLSGVS